MAGTGLDQTAIFLTVAYRTEQRFCPLNVIILTMSKMSVVIQFYRFDKFLNAKKAVSILPHKTKALFMLFCLQLMCWSEGKVARAVILPREAKLTLPKIQYIHMVLQICRSELDQTDDFEKVCRSGLAGIQLCWIRTGFGQKNFSPLIFGR